MPASFFVALAGRMLAALSQSPFPHLSFLNFL
jgi:hypothetical protein